MNEKQIGDGINNAFQQSANHTKAQASVEQRIHDELLTAQTEFVTLTGQPWNGDSANLIQLQCRVGSSIDGPFIYSDRVSRVNVIKRSEWVEPTFRDNLLSLRGSINELGERVIFLRGKPNPAIYINEARANLTLAYRHLEDAYMRLDKAIQAIDGGVNVFDK